MSATPSRKPRVRRSRRRPLVLLAICGFWAAVFVILCGPVALGPLELADLALQDAVVRHGARTATPPDFVFLAVDEPSMDLSQLDPDEIAASPALRLMSQAFPWSREVYALVIEKLLAAGAKAVVLDVHFPGPGSGDGALRETLARHGDRVVLASLYDDSGMGAGHTASQYRPPSDSVLPPSEDATSLVGFANFWPDTDRVVRAAHYRITAADLLGGEAGPGDAQHQSLAALALSKSGLGGDLPASGMMRFCAPGAFATVPLWTLFVPDTWDVNLRGGEFFRDKVVLLGPLAARFRDHFRTPVGTLPGPEIHLHAMAAGMAGSFYRRFSTAAVMASCMAMAALAFAINWLPRRPLTSLGLLALLLAGFAAFALLLYSRFGLLPGLLYPAATLVAAGLTCFAYDFSLERRERARVRRSLERYVSRDVVQDLLDRENDLLEQLGGTRKEVAVLLSDVRGFTKLAERADPAILVRDLNEYLGGMVEIVFRHAGTLDKFIGDAVLAVWGTVNTAGPREDAARAVGAALDMLAAVARLRAKWLARGGTDLALGIGIHCGPAIFGNIGSELKMEPTVIGDTVNLASRLESLTKRFGVPLLVSDAVVEATGDAFPYRTLGTVRVVGRSKPVAIFTVVLDGDARPSRPGWLAAHEEGWGHFRARRFAEAAESFAAASAGEPADAALQAMLAQCREFAAHPPGPDWEPVVNMESK